MRIVADRDALGEDQLPLLVEQEGGAPRDGGADDRAEQMADEAAADARVEHHRHRPARHPHRIEPGDGPLAGAAAGDFRRFEVGEVADLVLGIIALHARAGAGDDARIAAIAARRVAAAEAVAGRQSEDRPPRRSAAALAVGDAGDGAGGLLGRQGAFLERGGRGIGPVVALDVDGLATQQAIVGGEAGIGVLRRLARHRGGPFDQRRQRLVRQIRGGDARRAAADEQAQADLLAFGARDVLQLPEPDLHARRRISVIEGVGGVGARLHGALNEGGGARLGFGNSQHGGGLRDAAPGLQSFRRWCRRRGRRGT